MLSIILILSIIAAFFYHPKAITTTNNDNDGGQYSVIPLSSSSSAGTSSSFEAQTDNALTEDSPPAMQLAPKTWTDPWLNGFPYRKPISIAGSTSTLTQFQVNVTPYIYNETGLVGSWHFSESSGNATADSSGQGNTGYQYGSNRTTDGKFGNAMKFDGTDDYVDMGTSPSLEIPGPLTISIWLKTDKVQDAGLVVKWAGNVGYMLYQPNNDKASFLTDSSGTAVTTTSSITDGRWKHIVAVFNGTASLIYVNGTKEAEVSDGPATVSAQTLKLGIYSGSYRFNGTIDEVRIYNRSLSVTEIQQHYNATKARLDYADVRFTDSDGATLLPFWMESDGKFWVKVPSIPATGTTIYAYYGNPQANDAQNGTGTFEFFDDFNDGDYNGWTLYGGGPFTATYNYLEDTAGSGDIYISTTYVDRTHTAWEFKAKQISAGEMIPRFWHQTADLAAGGAYIIQQTPATTTARLSDGANTIDSGSYFNDGAWHTFRVTRSGTTWTFAVDGVGYGTSTNDLTSASDYWVFQSNSGKQAYDDVRIRKYYSPEPSATQGAEENITMTMSGSAQNWNWQPLNSSSIGGTGKIRSGSAQNWNWVSFQQYLGRYRKPITLAGSTSTLTDYQVNVTPYIYNETGLVGSWHFSESSGRTTADSSGQGNTGTFVNGANITIDGKFGNAAKFDGSDDYVSGGTAGMPSGPNPFTITAWIKPSVSQTSRAISYGAASSNALVWLSYASGYVKVIEYGAGSGVTSDTLSTAGGWDYVVVVYNGTAYSLYHNGADKGSKTAALSITSTYFWIGNTPHAGGEAFTGTIDEVRIYNRTLSASEIQQHYNATKARLDYQDIRFTDSDGATLLPFWMESDGKFWVKVPSIPTTGTTIYAYYGNPSANSLSNVTGTLELFEDFESSYGAGNLNGQNGWSGDVDFKVDGTDYHDGGQSAQLLTGGIGDAIAKSITRQNYTAEYWLKMTGTISLATVKFYEGATLIAHAGLDNGAFYDNVGTLGGSVTSGRWYSLRLVIRSDTNTHDIYVDDGATLKVTGRANAATISSGINKIELSSDGRWVTAWDTIRLRKYAAPEPSATQGTEEDSIIPQNITVPNGNAMNWTWYPS